MEQITRPLPIGMTIGQDKHRDFDLRAPLVEDMVEAEKTCDPRLIHAFNVALLTRVVTRVGTFSGPFTANMFTRLKRADYNAFISALLEVEELGEDESGAAATSTAVS